VFFSAINENRLIYAYSNKLYPPYQNDINVNLIINSINCLNTSTVKFGELIVFNYAITLILVNINLVLYFYLNNIPNDLYIYQSILFMSLMIFLQSYVPYLKIYLNNGIEAITKNIDLWDWFDYKYHYLSLTNESKIDWNLLISYDYAIEILNNFSYNSDSYEEYNKTIVKFTGKDNVTLTKKEYLQYLPFFRKSNIFIKDNLEIKQLMLSEDYIEIANTSLNLQPIYYSFFKEIDFNDILLSRFVEVTTFFVIINCIVFW